MPPVDSLTAQQRGALTASARHDGALIVTGCPGSGKTTVANHKVLGLSGFGDSNWMYFVYVRLLKQMIINSLEVEDPSINTHKIRTIYKWYSDISRGRALSRQSSDEIRRNFSSVNNIRNILIDEAQDLAPKIFSELDEITNRLLITCDNKQNIFNNWDSSTPVQFQIKSVLENSGWSVRLLHLNKNFRNTKPVYDFAFEVIKGITIEDQQDFFVKSGGTPVMIGTSFSEYTMLRNLLRILRANENINIGIFCEYKSQVNSIAKFLDNHMSYSKFHSKVSDEDVGTMTKNSTSNIILTTYHACKGLEFNLVIVPYANSLNVDRADSERNLTSRKLYYVGFSRASDRLILLTENHELRNLVASINPNTYVKRTL